MNNLKCPICNNSLQIGITYHNGGMDGSYKNWIVSCPSCNMFQKEYAADKFYGRKSYTKEQAVQCASVLASILAFKVEDTTNDTGERTT